MAIQIRDALPSDVKGIFDVRITVKENALTRAELEALGITEESVEAMIVASRCAWVATDGEAIVGFTMVVHEEGYLFAAFVLPEYEGRGIGKQLVLAAEKALFVTNAVIWLETGKTTRAAEFYRRLGWGKETAIGENDIRLEKSRCQGSRGKGGH